MPIRHGSAGHGIADRIAARRETISVMTLPSAVVAPVTRLTRRAFSPSTRWVTAGGGEENHS